MTWRFLANSIIISKEYSRRNTHSSDTIITGSTAITHQCYPGTSTLSFRKQPLEGKKKRSDGAEGVGRTNSEKLNICVSQNHHFSFVVVAKVLIYYTIFSFMLSWVRLISIFPFESCGMATNGNDDNTVLSHTVKRERKAPAADYYFSRCHSRVKVAMVIDYNCRSFPDSNGKAKQRKSTDNYVPSVSSVRYTDTQ